MAPDSRTPRTPNGHDEPILSTPAANTGDVIGPSVRSDVLMGVSRFLRTSSALRGRFLAYLVGFPGAIVVDRVTPNGVADWLIEVILVWIASVAGDVREMTVVAALGSITMVLGIFSAPATIVPSGWAR